MLRRLTSYLPPIVVLAWAWFVRGWPGRDAPLGSREQLIGLGAFGVFAIIVWCAWLLVRRISSRPPKEVRGFEVLPKPSDHDRTAK